MLVMPARLKPTSLLLMVAAAVRRRCRLRCAPTIGVAAGMMPSVSRLRARRRLSAACAHGMQTQRGCRSRGAAVVVMTSGCVMHGGVPAEHVRDVWHLEDAVLLHNPQPQLPPHVRMNCVCGVQQRRRRIARHDAKGQVADHEASVGHSLLRRGRLRRLRVALRLTRSSYLLRMQQPQPRQCSVRTDKAQASHAHRGAGCGARVLQRVCAPAMLKMRRRCASALRTQLRRGIIRLAAQARRASN
jgi:hypothetical protein